MALIAGLLSIVLTAAEAQAAPITLTWDFAITGPSAGSFNGTRVFGELAYAYDPAVNPVVITYNPDGSIATIQYPQVPVHYFVMNFGGRVFGLSDAISPPIFSPAVSNQYGLNFSLRPNALPGGATFSIAPAGSLFYSLSGPGGVHIGQEHFFVPETGSLALGAGASMIGWLGLLWLRRLPAWTFVRSGLWRTM